MYRGRCLHVEVKQGDATYSLRAGEALDLGHYGETISVAPDAPVTRPIPLITPGEAPKQPPGRAPARRRGKG